MMIALYSPGDEIAPGAVGADADPVEGVVAALEHVLVVRAGDDPEQVDFLLRRQRFERLAREIGPQIGLLRRAGIDMGEAGFPGW